MSREAMAKFVTQRLEKIHGRGRFTICNMKWVNNMIHVEYFDERKKYQTAMFSV